VVQLIGLLIIGVAGVAYPRLMLAVYIPLIVIVSICAALFMDNLATVRNDTGAAKEAVTDPQTGIMSLLSSEPSARSSATASRSGWCCRTSSTAPRCRRPPVTFIGPLLGSLIRPLGGWLSDRVGGTRVTFWNFLLMGVATLVCVWPPTPRRWRCSPPVSSPCSCSPGGQTAPRTR